MEYPPRYRPDNSEAAKAQRKKNFSWTGAEVTELPHRHVLPQPEGYNDNEVRLPNLVLGPMNNVVEVNFRPDDPPVQAA